MVVTLAGCGGSDDGAPASAPTPTATATRTGSPPVAAARVPVTLSVQADGQVTPRKVSVPARLPIQLTVHNRTPAPLTVSMEHVPGELDVPAGGSRSERVDALPKGRYEVRVGGAGSATVVVGVPPGP